MPIAGMLASAALPQLAFLVKRPVSIPASRTTPSDRAGDQVLQEVAGPLRNSLRASDTVARLGGDEFAVVLPATDVNRAELVARKMLHDLEHRFVADSPTVVGEGVERSAVLNQLAELNCDAAQGYFIMKPAPARATADWMDSRGAAAL